MSGHTTSGRRSVTLGTIPVDSTGWSIFPAVIMRHEFARDVVGVGTEKRQ